MKTLYTRHGVQVVIVEKHHHVLLPWASYRAAIPHAPYLLTLDYHTDTSPPFRTCLRQRYPGNEEAQQQAGQQRLTNVDWRDASSIEAAIADLANDEHVLTALQTDILAVALVVAQSARDTDLATLLKHKIICGSFDGQIQRTKLSKEVCDQALEPEFLRLQIEKFNGLLRDAQMPLFEERNYILDMDLDYLNTYRSAVPEDPTFIKSLANNAGLITIATEPSFVEHCALDVGLNSESLLLALSDLFDLTESTMNETF